MIVLIGPILRRAEAGRTPSRREILLMLRAEDEEYRSLLEVAGRICRQKKGEEPSLRFLVDLEVSDPQRIREDVVHAWRTGCASVLLCASSGYDAVDEVAALIRDIAEQTDMQVVLGLGERSYEVYALWRHAGAVEYLLPHDSCNPDLFSQLHPGHSPAVRLTRGLWLKGLGYRVTGGICVGIDGETDEDLADDLEVLRNAGLTGVMVRSAGCAGDLLRVLAITRLCLPDADLWVATDDPVLQARALGCGANILVTAHPAGSDHEVPRALSHGISG
ncbi:hypothetical protein [Symbiobacterium thermophilum]|nr:hypothetical protein [Symbiobacterium thermophilum]